MGRPPQVLEVVGVGLVHAPRVVDPHARRLRPRDCEAHRHAVVVVRVDRRRLQPAAFRRVDRQLVLPLVYLRPQLRQLLRQRRDAVGLLHPQRVQAADRRLALGEQGDDRQRLRRVGHAGEVHVGPFQPAGAADGDEVGAEDQVRPHRMQHVGEAHVSLEATLAQPLHGHLRPLMHRGRSEEVRRVTGVRLHRVVGRSVRLPRDDDLPRVARVGVAHQFRRHAELVHQPHRHRHVRPARLRRIQVDHHFVPRVRRHLKRGRQELRRLPAPEPRHPARQPVGVDDDRREPVLHRVLDPHSQVLEQLRQLPDRPLPHPGDAVERKPPLAQRAQGRQKPDRRPAVPAEQLGRVPVDLPPPAVDLDGVPVVVDPEAEAEPRQVLQHDVRVVGEQHVGQVAHAARQRRQHQRPVGQTLGPRRRNLRRKRR